jgi:hypothetical protein
MVWSASGAAHWTIPAGYGPRGTYGLAGNSLGSSSPRAMRSSRDSLPDRTGRLRRAPYAVILFVIGSIRGTTRVLLSPPQTETTAVIVESTMNARGGWFVCRRYID